MIYDLAQPHYNNGPQFPGQPPNSILYQQHVVVEGATGRASRVDDPFRLSRSITGLIALERNPQ
jgi:hypothetical protein